MIMNEKSNKWLEAAKVLAKDVNEKIICPECGISHLVVKDGSIEGWDQVIGT